MRLRAADTAHGQIRLLARALTEAEAAARPLCLPEEPRNRRVGVWVRGAELGCGIDMLDQPPRQTEQSRPLVRQPTFVGRTEELRRAEA